MKKNSYRVFSFFMLTWYCLSEKSNNKEQFRTVSNKNNIFNWTFSSFCDIEQDSRN